MTTAASRGAVVVFPSPWHFEPVLTGGPVIMYTYLKTMKVLRRKKLLLVVTVRKARYETERNNYVYC